MHIWQKTSFPSARRVNGMTSILGKKDKQGKKIFNLPKHSLWFPRPATPFFIRFYSLEKNGQFSLPAFESLSQTTPAQRASSSAPTEYQQITSCDQEDQRPSEQGWERSGG